MEELINVKHWGVQFTVTTDAIGKESGLAMSRSDIQSLVAKALYNHGIRVGPVWVSKRR